MTAKASENPRAGEEAAHKVAPDHEGGVTAPGWPRPLGTYEPRRGWHAHRGEPRALPVPWVIEIDSHNGEAEVAWTTFHDQSTRAHSERLCQVCGEALGRILVLGVSNMRSETSGPGCHPRCAALAIRFCPHFAEIADDETIAYIYEGEGVGYLWPSERPPRGSRREPPDPIDEVIASGEEEPYTLPNPVVAEARPLTRDEVKQLAKDNPLGT